MRQNILILLLNIFLITQAQDVTVMLTAKYQGIPVFLDSIILENLTQPNQIILSPLPKITAYQIDLNKGLIINAINEHSDEHGIYVTLSQLGFYKVIVSLSQPQNLKFELFDLTGKLLVNQSVRFTAGSHLTEVHTGNEPITILHVHGDATSESFILIGGKEQVTSIIQKDCNDFSCPNMEPISVRHSSVSGFIFSPGDAVRFTAIRTGMYPNTFISKPLNLDSIIIFLSIPCPDNPVVYDYDGNLYPTVQIGSQCWMRENMRTTHYSNGIPLVNGTGAGNISGDYFTKYWFDYNDDPSNSVIYGKLYNGPAVLNLPYNPNGYPEKIQGVCPAGWHVSSDKDWMRMEAYLGMGADTNLLNEWRGFNIGGKLKETDTIHWTTVNKYATNESGFSGMGGGGRDSNGPYSSLRSIGLWWALNNTNYYPFYDRKMTNLMPSVYRGIGDFDFGYSCRCVKD